MLLCYIEYVPGFLEARSGDHELGAPQFDRPLEDIRKVIFVGLFAVVYPAIYWVAKVDADLRTLLTG